VCRKRAHPLRYEKMGISLPRGGAGGVDDTRRDALEREEAGGKPKSATSLRLTIIRRRERVENAEWFCRVP